MSSSMNLLSWQIHDKVLKNADEAQQSSNNLITKTSKLQKFKRQQLNWVLRQVEGVARCRKLKQSRWTNSLRLDVAGRNRSWWQNCRHRGESRIRQIKKTPSIKLNFHLRAKLPRWEAKQTGKLWWVEPGFYTAELGGWWAWLVTGMQVPRRTLESWFATTNPRQTQRRTDRQTNNMKGTGRGKH